MESTSISGGDATIVASHVPKTLRDDLASIARTNDRTISGEIRSVLRRHVADFRRNQIEPRPAA
jgi:hypothetical protein